MKQVIDGKTYNTETAELIGEWSNSYGRSDFQWCEEALYRTKKGAFFIAGEGGAMSRWAQSYGNSRGSGSGIILLSPADALAWCERRCQEAIEGTFEIEEG